MPSGSTDLPELEAKTMQEVRNSTRYLLRSFKAKIDELKNTAGPDIQKLLRFGVDYPAAASTAESFFGSDEVRYIAVDGTQGVDQHLDLLVFYVGAFGYSGTLSFKGGDVRVGDPSPMAKSSAAVSASIPLSEEDAATVFGQRTESGTEVDTERLPNALMHLAEYYIAVRALDSELRPRVVILDRTLAGDVSHLVWSTRDLVRGHASVLEGIITPSGQVTSLDLELTRMLVINPRLETPASRSQLLRYAALARLFDGSALTIAEILDELDADPGHAGLLTADFAEMESEFSLFEEAHVGRERKFKLKDGVKDYWERVQSAAHAVADHVFNPRSGHPLRLGSGDQGGRWITADDLDYLILVFTLELVRRAWADDILPLGLVKDSGASELVKAVIPLLRNARIDEFGPLPNFNSDKMLLQTNSVVNAATVPTPWHSIDMDAAFRTMIPVTDPALPRGQARAKGAYRNVINTERTFVKVYIQLWSSKNDPAVRSHVFTFDRPAYAAYDAWGEITIRNRDNELDEMIAPILNLREGSAMTNLAMAILVRMSVEVVPEALGHNYPLFLADKKAKVVLEQGRKAYVGAVEVEMAKSELDQQVLFSQRQTADGSSTVTFSTARIDCDYSPNVIKKLSMGQLVAIPNVQTLGADDVFSIYEIADVFPMHYSQLNLDRTQPAAIRKEFMELIESEWKKGSKSTWIEIVAAPIGYVMKTVDGSIAFERKPYAPLTGSSVKLLSKESVEKLICYKVPKGQATADYKFGNLLGVIDSTIPFTVDIEKLIHYHVGVFAFSLDYGEPLVYREGGQVKMAEIGKLVDSFFAKPDEEGRRYTDSLEVVSFDPENYEVSWKPIRYVFRHKAAGKLLRFTARTGRNVTVTAGHSLFILRKGRVLCLPASEIGKGDFLLGTRLIPNEPEANVRINLAEMLAESSAMDVVMVGVPESASTRIGLGKAPGWKPRRWRHAAMLPLSYWPQLMASERKRVKLAYEHSTSPFSPILEVDKDLARLLGYYAAKGNVVMVGKDEYAVCFTLNKKERRTIAELRRILRQKFGIVVRVHERGEGGTHVTFRSRMLVRFLKGVVGTGARRKRVPDMILSSPSGVRAEFIRAWAECDYTTSSSRRLTSDLLYMLLFDGCAGAVDWIPPHEALTSGRRVHGRGRYQFSFPRWNQMTGTIRPHRKTADPTYPLAELPRSLNALLTHRSQLGKVKPRLAGKILAELEGRLDTLMDYDGSKPKDIIEALYDGVYRSGLGTHLVKGREATRAPSSVLQAYSDMNLVKLLQQSNLGFYEVQKIEEVEPTSPFVYDVSVPQAENFLAGFGGLFCHNTGSGKSNLTATVIRKALKVIPDLKVVILDLSSEYGMHILDVLNEYPSKVIFTDSFAGSKNKAAEYFKRHVCPEVLASLQPQFEKKIGQLFDDGKVVFAELPLEGMEEVEKFSTYGGLIEVLTNTLNDKYGAVQQKIYVPQVITQIKQFMHDEGFAPDTRFNAKTAKLIAQIQTLIGDLPATSSLKKSFDALGKVVETTVSEDEQAKSPWETLPDEILSNDAGSPRVFVINLPEAEDARAQTADVINRVFRKRKKSFSLTPKVMFIVDEAQEFIPQDARKGDNAFESSRMVERLLRHGRKYNLFCWVSTQRIAHLNTNALQQLHSYFISTMPRPYDRQLVADTFAIGDAFVDRTLAFQNGDWLLTSFKATATQNIPVFFHAENNEDTLRKYLAS